MLEAEYEMLAAQAAYEAYCEYAALVTGNSKWPGWNNLSVPIRGAWNAAAKAAAEVYRLSEPKVVGIVDGVEITDADIAETMPEVEYR